MKRRHPVVSALPAVAILVLGAGLFAYHGEIRELSDRTQRLRDLAVPRTVRAELLGQRLDRVGMADLVDDGGVVPGDRKRFTVLWFVNPNDCVNCLENLQGWNRLAEHAAVHRVAVLVGIGRAAGTGLARRAALRGQVVVDPNGTRTRELVGELRLPYLVLLVDSRGRILAAEAGSQRTPCTADPLDHVARLVEAASPQLRTRSQHVSVAADSP